MQRWQVTVYNLSYEFDREGLNEIKQRELKRKLEALTDNRQRVSRKPGWLEECEEEAKISKDDELIRRASNGKLILFKSNFDFLEKPASAVDDYEIKMHRHHKQDKSLSAKA